MGREKWRSQPEPDSPPLEMKSLITPPLSEGGTHMADNIIGKESVEAPLGPIAASI